MNLAAIVEEIKFKLTGGIMDLELDDAALEKTVQAAFRELQRYISTHIFKTLPFSRCIDMSEYKVNNVISVMRTSELDSSSNPTASNVDPMLASIWQFFAGGGNMYNFNNYALNYASYSTISQIRNTSSTDLNFIFDVNTQKLYINTSTGTPSDITVVYIPIYEDVDDIKSNYWIDILIKLSCALAKVTLGRIRSKYTQSNALWTLDGETMLAEGNAELTEIREHLKTNSHKIYPID